MEIQAVATEGLDISGRGEAESEEGMAEEAASDGMDQHHGDEGIGNATPQDVIGMDARWRLLGAYRKLTHGGEVSPPGSHTKSTLGRE